MFRSCFFHSVLCSGLIMACAISSAGQRGLPAQQGIVNFAKVSDGLYRGAQPDTVAVSNLQKLGVRTIIDLRMPNRVRKAEETEARGQGLAYTNVPMHGLGRPGDEQVRNVLSLIENLPGPVFIHCEYGCDRTGTVVACYRIKHDKWSPKVALQEAARHGMYWFERGMKSFVVDYAKAATQLAKN